MEILLDTNFIISCIKKKIDFVSFTDELLDSKIEFLVPNEVINEIISLGNRRGQRTKDKQSARIALDLIKKSNFKIVNLRNPNVDQGIINYLNENPQIILATNDNGLGKKAKCKILKIRGEKGLGIF